MPKEIKKHYNYLDLPYSSNIEEVRLREKVLIKILNTKESKKGVKYTEKLNKVVDSANAIVAYIEKNGVQDKDFVMFDTKTKSIVNQILIFLMLAVVAVCAVFALI